MKAVEGQRSIGKNSGYPFDSAPAHVLSAGHRSGGTAGMPERDEGRKTDESAGGSL